MQYGELGIMCQSSLKAASLSYSCCTCRTGQLSACSAHEGFIWPVTALIYKMATPVPGHVLQDAPLVSSLPKDDVAFCSPAQEVRGLVAAVHAEQGSSIDSSTTGAQKCAKVCV